MKSESISIIIGFLVLMGVMLMGAIAGQSNAYNKCIVYHEQLSVVEAHKTCTAIIKGIK